MRLVEMQLRQVAIPMRFSFKHALAERSTATNLIVRVMTDSGHVGYGEVLPRKYLTGETLESARRDLLERWWPKAKGLWLPDPSEQPDAVFAALEPIYLQADGERKTGSYAGLDIAVFDAWARAAVRPVASVWHGPVEPVKLTAPLGGGSLKTVRRAAVWFKRLGFTEFKLKVGIAHLDDDIARIEAVRAVIGNACDLRVDCNAAFTPMEAILAMRRFADFGVSSVEQPIPPGSPTDLAVVQDEGGMPVMADESLCTLDDAKHLVALKSAKLWNLRPAKVGGFSGMRAHARLAQKHGIELHLGVLVGETSLMASAGRACLGMAPLRHVEYGFPRVLLKGDPFRGGPGGYFGVGKPMGQEPGLGIRAVSQQLERCTQWKLTVTA